MPLAKCASGLNLGPLLVTYLEVLAVATKKERKRTRNHQPCWCPARSDREKPQQSLRVQQVCLPVFTFGFFNPINKETGWTVLEINASNSRTGRDISSLFSEATHSHSVRTYFGTNEEEAEGAPLEAVTAPNGTASPSPSALVLVFEEVDIVFDEDKGFFAALRSLIVSSKRPVVLTCNSMSFPLCTKMAGACAANHYLFRY